MSGLTTLWVQTLADEVLTMPGPFQMLTPKLLLMLGIGALGTATGLLGITVMNTRMASGNVRMNARKRYLFALSFGGTAMGAVGHYPLLTDAYAYLSFLILLVLPIVVSTVIVRALVRADV